MYLALLLAGLKKLNYLSRLFPFKKYVRRSQISPQQKKEVGKTFDEDQYKDKQHNEGENNEDESNAGYHDEDQYEANELEFPEKRHLRNCRKARHHF